MSNHIKEARVNMYIIAATTEDSNKISCNNNMNLFIFRLIAAHHVLLTWLCGWPREMSRTRILKRDVAPLSRLDWCNACASAIGRALSTWILCGYCNYVTCLTHHKTSLKHLSTHWHTLTWPHVGFECMFLYPRVAQR